MACIDKIYGTCYEWDSLYLFLTYKKHAYIKYMYHRPKKEGRLCNFGQYEDEWLFKNCQFGFVQDALREQHPSWYK